MSDIVERLRQGAGHEPEDVMEAERLMDQAAAEIERLRALLNAEPVLTDDQREQLTNGFGAILPAEAIFALGWRTALGNARRALEQKP